MTIAGSVFLIALGAILYFATDFDIAEVSVDTIGLILMAAGVAGLLLGFFQQEIWTRRRGEEAADPRRDPREPPY